VVLQTLRRQANDLKRRPLTVDDLLTRLEMDVPLFVAMVRSRRL
jgi:hypothetical protein